MAISSCAVTGIFSAINLPQRLPKTCTVLARRKGIDFILDPIWASIRDDLHEHIDGLRSVF